ncbi:MAG: phosphatase PAP2 family protein [Lysobacteraceae bacterium]|nr:MAG: phosphatase PAP2 family protein [Xanthomonadaceae bacterium]
MTARRFDFGSGDRRLCLAMNRWVARRALVRLFRVVSRLGDGVFWYALMAAIALLAGARGPAIALQMALTGLLAATLYRLLKRCTRRPRPFRAHAAIIAYTAPLDEFSFPSGHTLHAVTFSLVALAHLPVLAPLLVPFTLLVAVSRIVLGLHYPSDVLAAMLIGIVLAASSLQVGAWLSFA